MIGAHVIGVPVWSAPLEFDPARSMIAQVPAGPGASGPAGTEPHRGAGPDCRQRPDAGATAAVAGRQPLTMRRSRDEELSTIGPSSPQTTMSSMRTPYLPSR